MITRGQMPRQLRNKGGITNVVPREGFIFGGITKRIRKLIPNEIANFASKAAPFVAPFNPGAAALMRGIGRFDKRGSFSDAIKQGLGTFAFGKAAGYLGGAQSDGGIFGGQTFSKQGFSEGPVGRLFQGGKEKLLSDGVTTGAKTDKGVGFIKKGTEMFKDVPILGELPNIVQQQILVGGATAAGSYIYQKFLADEPPQDEGETMEEYLARRKQNVGNKMRTYFDNYFKFDPEYSALDDAGKDAFVARYNLKKGGRVGYQTGGITMANTLAENIRRNIANQAAVAQQFQAARSRLPGYVEPVVPPAPTQPILEESDEGTIGPVLPVEPPTQMPIEEEPKVIPIESDMIPIPLPGGGGGFGSLLPGLIGDVLDQDPDAFAPQPTLPVEPQTDQDILEGYAKFKEQNPGVGMGPGLQVMIYGRLPNGTPLVFPNSAQAAAFNQYLESIGQPPFERVSGDIRKITDNEEKSLSKLAGGGMPTGGRVGYQNGGISMANTLAENIRRNRAAQAAFNQMIRPAQIKASKITPSKITPIQPTPSKITPIQPTPSKITPIETRPIEIKELNLNRNPALNFFKPQQPQFLTPTKTQIQTGPQPGELDPLGLPMSMTMLPGDGLQSLAEMEAITKRIEAAQAAMKPTYEERLMGESWDTLSDNDQYIIAQEYPGETPPRRNPDFVPGLASGGMPTGIMKTNKAGVMERDYRDKGGFVPVGIKEKADDVPAMLSKNEFVFTADAVRGAGNGSIEKGAQKMYDTMKKLEKRVV